MARTITVKAGPYAAASATKIATSQKAAGSQLLVLNGAAGVATANNICLSQSPGGAGNLTLNGSLAITVASVTTAVINANSYIYITSGGNDSGNTFTVTGIAYGVGGAIVAVTETITGSNASVVSSAKQYYTITQIAISGASGGTVTVGTWGTATLDTARCIRIASAGNDSGISFTINGTDWAGMSISETLTGSNGGNADSVLSYLTVTSIKSSAAVASTLTIGTAASAMTNGVGASPWIRLDEYSAMGPVAIQVTTSGTFNSTVQQTLQDPNSSTDSVAVGSMSWVNHPDSNLVSLTGTVQGNYAYPPLWARLVGNSGTGSASMILTQNYQK